MFAMYVVYSTMRSACSGKGNVEVSVVDDMATNLLLGQPLGGGGVSPWIESDRHWIEIDESPGEAASCFKQGERGPVWKLEQNIFRNAAEAMDINNRSALTLLNHWATNP